VFLSFVKNIEKEWLCSSSPTDYEVTVNNPHPQSRDEVNTLKQPTSTEVMENNSSHLSLIF